MGLDYYANLAIGFEINEDEFLARLEVTVPGKSHTEERFDPMTGSKLPSVTIFDTPNRHSFTFENVVSVDAYGMMEYLESRFKFESYRNSPGTSDDWGRKILQPTEIKVDRKNGLEGKFSTSGRVDFRLDGALPMMQQWWDALARLKSDLARADLKVGDPCIVVASYVS